MTRRARANPDPGTVLGVAALGGAAWMAHQFGQARQLGFLQPYYDAVAKWVTDRVPAGTGDGKPKPIPAASAVRNVRYVGEAVGGSGLPFIFVRKLQVRVQASFEYRGPAAQLLVEGTIRVQDVGLALRAVGGLSGLVGGPQLLESQLTPQTVDVAATGEWTRYEVVLEGEINAYPSPYDVVGAISPVGQPTLWTKIMRNVVAPGSHLPPWQPPPPPAGTPQDIPGWTSLGWYWQDGAIYDAGGSLMVAGVPDAYTAPAAVRRAFRGQAIDLGPFSGDAEGYAWSVTDGAVYRIDGGGGAGTADDLDTAIWRAIAANTGIP